MTWLLEGDCLEVLPRFPDESVDAIVTDPPYNIGRDGTKPRKDYHEWLREVWSECGRIAKDEALLVFSWRVRCLPDLVPPEPWRLWHIGVWHKPLSLGGCWYGIAPHWEPLIFLLKGKKPWRPFRSKEVFSDVYVANVQLPRHGHPTEKPVGLYTRLLDFACPPGGLVLDPLCGSGTTLIAAAKTGRSAVGIEINPDYISIAKNRLEAEV